MRIEAKSVDEYLSKVPEERQEAFNKLRQVILDNIPEGFDERLSYGMVGYVVPHELYSAGYHCSPELPLPFANIANQKNFIGFYHMGVYANKEVYDWFVSEYPKHCKYKLDMGKSCIRLKKIDQIPYDLIGTLVSKMSVDRWIELYEKSITKR